MRSSCWLALGAVAVCAVTGCGAGVARSGGNGLQVVAGENVWGNIATQIGGTRVSVTSIVTDPSTDPHSYETDAGDAAAVGSAALVIENGAGYDDFLDKLVTANPRAERDVLLVAGVVGARGDNVNPHLWYSPAYVTATARAIAARLSARDPAGADTFDGNLRAFLAAYAPYSATLDTIRTRHSGAPVGYTERVPGYLLDAAGLRVVTRPSFAQAIEDGDDPSPADISAMDSSLTQHQIKVLLYNAQVTSAATESVRQLAVSSNIPVVGVGETLPAGGSSFQSWQIAQARAILAALG